MDVVAMNVVVGPIQHGTIRSEVVNGCCRDECTVVGPHVARRHHE